MEEVNQRIRRVLEDSGLTAAEFAERVHVQRSSISHILSGRNKPSLDFITKLYHAFPDIDVAYLITGDKSKRKPAITTADRSDESEPSARQEENKKVEFTNVNTSDSSRPDTVVNSEDGPEYGSSPSDEQPLSKVLTSSNRVSKIILLYEDGRFQEFTP